MCNIWYRWAEKIVQVNDWMTLSFRHSSGNDRTSKRGLTTFVCALTSKTSFPKGHTTPLLPAARSTGHQPQAKMKQPCQPAGLLHGACCHSNWLRVMLNWLYETENSRVSLSSGVTYSDFSLTLLSDIRPWPRFCCLSPCLTIVFSYGSLSAVSYSR